jgi:hypothetical protein
LHCDLQDGRTISVPLAWYPQLQRATNEQRNDWRLTGRGRGIYWPQLDEDLSVQGFMAAGGQRREEKALYSKPTHATYVAMLRAAIQSQPVAAVPAGAGPSQAFEVSVR